MWLKLEVKDSGIDRDPERCVMSDPVIIPKSGESVLVFDRNNNCTIYVPTTPNRDITSADLPLVAIGMGLVRGDHRLIDIVKEMIVQLKTIEASHRN